MSQFLPFSPVYDFVPLNLSDPLDDPLDREVASSPPQTAGCRFEHKV